jgi:hypothetical protein
MHTSLSALALDLSAVGTRRPQPVVVVLLPRSRSMIRFLSSIPSLVADAVRL